MDWVSSASGLGRPEERLLQGGQAEEGHETWGRVQALDGRSDWDFVLRVLLPSGRF